MSEILFAEDPEPQPGQFDILEGVPHGYNLSRDQSEKFREAIGPHLGRIVSCLTSDYFVIPKDSEIPSYEWRHFKSTNGPVVGQLVTCDRAEVYYELDELEHAKVVQGVVLSATESEESYFIAAEDTQSVHLAQ